MSIVEIAKEAGVSISTVSRFFNRPDKVSAEAAAKIRVVTEKRNYQPDMRRPGPKTAERVGIKTGAIAFLSLGETSPEEMLKKPAFPLLIGSIQRTLIARQLSLILAHLEKDGNPPGCLDSRSCDGVILFGKPNGDELMHHVRRKLGSLPAVWCFREHADPEREFDHILYDNQAVGTLAADYLARRGHRKVALFNTDMQHSGFLTRINCFTQRAKELGIEVVSFIGKPDGPNAVSTFQGMADAFMRNADGITGAFFCADDIMLGVHNELRAAGFPGKQLDMVGVNADEVLLRYISPRPATIDIKISQVGEMAVDHLLRRINSEKTTYSSEIFIKPELIEGER